MKPELFGGTMSASALCRETLPWRKLGCVFA